MKPDGGSSVKFTYEDLLHFPDDGKWHEIIGSGLVHPNVFRAAKIDPNEWQGFAFAVGLDRLVMLKYGIPDVRLFYSGDLRLVNQF